MLQYFHVKTKHYQDYEKGTENMSIMLINLDILIQKRYEKLSNGMILLKSKIWHDKKYDMIKNIT